MLLKCSTAVIVLQLAGPLMAQCTLAWQAGIGAYPGTDAAVTSVQPWDPDGSGPLPPGIAVVGSFRLAGGLNSQGVAYWNPLTGTWSAAGIDAYSAPIGATTLLGGLLVTGGSFWSGGTWNLLPNISGPSGTNGQITALNGSASGLLAGVYGGPFPTTYGVVRLVGSGWQTIGTSIGGWTGAVLQMPNGDIIAGGSARLPGSLAADNIVRWDGTAWTPLGGGTNGTVTSLALLANGDLIAGGQFTTAGGLPANRVARWDGTAWSPLGSGLDGDVWSLFVEPNGDLLVGGSFAAAGGNPARALARWRGGVWSSAGTVQTASGATGTVYSITGLPNGDLVIGGRFDGVDGFAAANVAHWNGAWHPTGTGVAGTITTSVVMADGDVVVGGSFGSIGGVPANRVARWNGATWQSLGGGIDAPVLDLIELPNGDLLAGGGFTTAGGAPASHIARWDGSAWSQVGPGLGGPVTALALMPNGDIVAACISGVGTWGGMWRWNGVSWQQIGGPSDRFGTVYAMVVVPNGDLVVGGRFGQVDGAGANGIAYWNGATWGTLGGIGVVRSLVFRPNGELFAGGDGFVSRWTGTSWIPTAGAGLGLNSVEALQLLPNGDLIAGGASTNGPGLARWNGSSWTVIDGIGSTVATLALDHRGELVVCGSFATAGGASSVGLARLAPTCPASVGTFGTGCSGSYGPVTVTADSLPWIGASYSATATGFGPDSLALWVAGGPPLSVPLSAIHPAGLPGCMLLSSFDVEFTLQYPTGNSSTSTVFIPNLPAIVGMTFTKQVGNLEVDASLNIVHASSSNALSVTVGSF